MKRRRVLFIRLSQFRIFLRKLLVTLVVISAFGLVILSKADNAHLNKTEDIVSRVLNPVIRIIQLPADGLYYVYEKIRDVARVYADNKVLRYAKDQRDDLEQKLQALKSENELLSQMLYYTPPAEADFVTAKVVASEGDGFVHSLIVYIGSAMSVKKGQVVLHKQGVVGRIDAIHGAYARVLLISDINSKIPVIIERTRAKGILSGNNTAVLNLLYTAPKADIVIGDKILTSGVGGLFPSGLAVGYVSAVSPSSIEITPLEPIETIEYVKIVNYGAYDDIFEKGGD